MWFGYVPSQEAMVGKKARSGSRRPRLDKELGIERETGEKGEAL
jgi:hypothetical protein